MTQQPKEIVSEKVLVQQRQHGLAVISPIKQRVTAMVVKTADDYEMASEALASIRQARKDWEGRLNPIIEPIRASLDLLYGLRKDILTPLDELEGMVKERMKAFKLEEARQLQATKEAEEKERQRLEAEAQKKAQAEASAKTQAMRTKLANQRAELEQKLASAKHAPVAAPVKSSRSVARKVTKPVVKDKLALLAHVLANPDLCELIDVNSGQLYAYYQLEQPKVGPWLPGVEIEEDITIAGRG